MNRIFSVERLLNAEQLKQFIAMAPRRTTDELHEWMLARGKTIGRTAVGNYLRRLRQQTALRFVPLIGCESDAARRRQLTAWAAMLSGETLAGLLRFAAYQINLQAAFESWPAERIKELSPGVRRPQKGVSKRV
jgi:hypothetical protein